MWARVKASQVIEIIPGPKAMTINGVQYPSSIFRIWKPEALKAIGLYSYSETGQKDTFYYNMGGISYTVDDSAGTVVGKYSSTAKALADTTYSNTDKSNGDIPEGKDVGDVKAEGLKTVWKKKVKDQAAGMISKYDWYSMRLAQAGTSIPKAVNTYMNSVRANSGIMETKIDAASDVDALIALDTTTYHANGDLKLLAHLQTWPTDPND